MDVSAVSATNAAVADSEPQQQQPATLAQASAVCEAQTEPDSGNAPAAAN